METKYVNFDSIRKFGVEFEVNPSLTKQEIKEKITEFEALSSNPKTIVMESGEKGWAESLDNYFWHVKYDSTCGFQGKKKIDGGGWEIASYIASGIKDINHISNVGSMLKDSGAVTNDFCGLHIHVEVDDFSENDINTLLAYWVKIESFISNMLPKHRKKNKYCKLLRNKMEGLNLAEPLWSHLKPHNLEVHENPDKRTTLNTVGVARKFVWGSTSRCTVELRWPECDLNKNHIYNWIVFIVNFIDNCKNRELPKNYDSINNIEEFFECLGIQSNVNFLIPDDNLHILKLWILKKIIANGSTKKVISSAKDKLVFLNQI